jgi:predicted transposase/invertase (TIGR01784 family)
MELFSNKEAFYSLLKDCVKADWIAELDIGSLKRNNASFILQDYKKKEADIVYEATINNGRKKVIFYILLELQSRVDYRMPYRLLLYIVEILRYSYNSSDVTGRVRKNYKFPAVVPIVFFSGSRKWTVPTNLREMFDGYENFGDSLLNFNYSLVDVKGYNDESVKGFHSKLLKVIVMLEKSASITDLGDVIKKYKNEISQFTDEEMRIIRVGVEILDSIYKSDGDMTLSEALKTQNVEEVSSMLTNLVANEKRRAKQLIKQGRQEERLETAKALLDMGLPMEQILKATRMTIEDIERIKKELSN